LLFVRFAIPLKQPLLAFSRAFFADTGLQSVSTPLPKTGRRRLFFATPQLKPDKNSRYPLSSVPKITSQPGKTTTQLPTQAAILLRRTALPLE